MGGTDGETAIIAATLAAWYGPTARATTITPRAGGEQGFSGATLRYYDVAYTRGEASERMALVTKDVAPVERQTLAWLGARGLPVPRSHAVAMTTDTRAPVCMEYAGEPSPTGGGVHEVARALAAIHAAALGQRDTLPPLPAIDRAYFTTRLFEVSWRGPWQRLLTGAGYTDWYGRLQPPTAPDEEFGAAFGPALPALEAAAARFCADLDALWTAGDTLTLVHADFHGGNIRWHGDRPRILDWEQACYGPLYLDLTNYFTREEALLYRDALADLGHAIPLERFLAGYDAARPYPGLKYFGIGLWAWQHGDPTRRHGAVQYWIDLALGRGKNGTGK